MSVLPPVEIAQLDCSALQTPGARSGFSLSSLGGFSHFSPSLAHLSSRLTHHWPKMVIALGMLLLIPVGTTLALQPRQPQLSPNQKAQTVAYVESQNQPLLADAEANPSVQPSVNGVEPAGSTNPTPLAQVGSASQTNVADNNATGHPSALLTAANASPGYNYQLSLAQSFLKKAVELSQASGDHQTDHDRQSILTTLEQALSAANKAIDLDGRQGAGFLVRARVFKTASVIKPELAQASEQDLTIARTLGFDANQVNPQDPLQYMPTEQATHTAGIPVVASPEETKAKTVGQTASNNVLTGEIVMAANSQSVEVDFPTLRDSDQVRVSLKDGSTAPNNITVSVGSRTSGKGFTILSTEAPTSSLTLVWTVLRE
jgi:hypothetical protein